MYFDAVILAGGRSSRLSGEPKAGLVLHGQTLLQLSVAAASRAGNIVVVGDPPGAPFARAVQFVREDPPFGGPAAAIAAGLRVLASAEGHSADATLILACDMPGVGPAVSVLLDSFSAASASVDGAIARDTDRRSQPLAAVYRTRALRAAVKRLSEAGGVDGVSVRTLIAGLTLEFVEVAPGTTDDIDTWADADRRGVTRP